MQMKYVYILESENFAHLPWNMMESMIVIL